MFEKNARGGERNRERKKKEKKEKVMLEIEGEIYTKKWKEL